MQAEKCMVNRYTFVGKHACTIARNRSGSVSVSKDSVILNTGREIGSSQHIVKENSCAQLEDTFSVMLDGVSNDCIFPADCAADLLFLSLSRCCSTASGC